ncbi:MAG: flagellar M-ring protein FliF [Planctomycetales bacterium]|nr:flagellar M-ring protein FliF [Planctomycetales bacterium]
MDDQRRVTTQLKQFWTRLSLVAQVIYGGTTLGLLGLVVWVAYWAAKPEYRVLLSGLQTEDAAAIVQKLESDHVAYELASGGTTILVPADCVQKVRMNLAVSGLPQGAGKGFELFDDMSMGATPFVQNLNYVRAIQGELARTIMQLEPVAQARVHIVQPDPTPFVREEKPVTASVVVKTKPGAALGRSATAGIVALVAGSVKGLSPDHVTVLDTEGRVLSEKRDPRDGIVSSDQLGYQRDVEANLASKAEEILSRLLGPGRAVVRVTAEMSFRHIKESTEKFDPEGKVVTHESSVSSKTTSPGGTRGAAGAVSNIPPAQPNAPAPNASASQKLDETIESQYAVSKVNRQLEEQQGTIDRLTVAVMLIPPSTDASVTPEEALGITTDEAKELVKQAVGFKDGRDQIQVSVGKVAEAKEDAAAEGDPLQFQKWQNYASLVRASSLGIASLVGLVMLVLVLRRLAASESSQTDTAQAASVAKALPSELQDLGAVAETLKSWLNESPRDRELQPGRTATQQRS